MAFNKNTGLYEGFIYCIENIVNHKKYIGQTCKTISQRFSEHVWDSSNNPGRGMVLHKAIKKYSPKAFTISEIARITDTDRKRLEEHLDELEIYYISEYKTLTPNGYNVTRGGNYRADNVLVPVYCFTKDGVFVDRFESISEAERRMNICHSDISGAINPNSYRQSAGGYIWSTTDSPPFYDFDVARKWRKPVQQIDKNGNVVAVYESANIAASELGLQNTLISACCHGRRKTTGGFGWSFLND